MPLPKNGDRIRVPMISITRTQAPVIKTVVSNIHLEIAGFSLDVFIWVYVFLRWIMVSKLLFIKFDI